MGIHLQRIIDSLANQTLGAFDLASGVDHPGESGRAREETIRRFLTQIVPPEFGIDTGFVIDAHERTSKQVDIVIYHKSRFPVLDVGGVKHFMIESVAAAIETKAVIGSTAVLKDALDNLASVKVLDRTNGQKNRALPGHEAIRSDYFPHQVWTAIIAGRSMVDDAVTDVLGDWLDVHDRTLWPNCYVDIREFLVSYVIIQDGLARADDRSHAS